MQVYYPDLYHSKLLNTPKRDEIRLLLSKYKEIYKSPQSKNTMDISFYDGISIFYDINNQISEIELFHEHSSFYIDGINIFDINLLELKNILTRIGKEYEIVDNEALDIDNHNISFYVPDLYDEGDMARIETIVISKRNILKNGVIPVPDKNS